MRDNLTRQGTEYKNDGHWKNITLGLCIRCGKNPPTANTQRPGGENKDRLGRHCDECKEAKRQEMKKYRARKSNPVKTYLSRCIQ
jgi:hypothetical protein